MKILTFKLAKLATDAIYLMQEHIKHDGNDMRPLAAILLTVILIWHFRLSCNCLHCVINTLCHPDDAQCEADNQISTSVYEVHPRVKR
jgi:hypothetical protein